MLAYKEETFNFLYFLNNYYKKSAPFPTWHIFAHSYKFDPNVRLEITQAYFSKNKQRGCNMKTNVSHFFYTPAALFFCITCEKQRTFFVWEQANCYLEKHAWDKPLLSWHSEFECLLWFVWPKLKIYFNRKHVHRAV